MKLNKKIFFIPFFVAGAILIPLAIVHAQQSASSSVRTTIGNPPTIASSCPIPGGVPSCGSERVPVNTSTSGGLCGHCGAGYGGYVCDYPGIHYAMDIPGTPLQPIIMPSVDGAKIKWVFNHQSVGSDGITAIQYYGGTDENTGDQYWIQFHHTLPGSGSGIHYSGEEGAKICQTGCDTGSGPHVHVEFAKVSSSGQMLWQDAPLYFCK